jgi:hypothetical protein
MKARKIIKRNFDIKYYASNIGNGEFLRKQKGKNFWMCNSSNNFWWICCGLPSYVYEISEKEAREDYPKCFL